MCSKVGIYVRNKPKNVRATPISQRKQTFFYSIICRQNGLYISPTPFHKTIAIIHEIPNFGFLFSLDYENRGLKKFGDKCDSTQECGFHGSICDSKKRSCQCIEELPATNHIDKCGKGK